MSETFDPAPIMETLWPSGQTTKTEVYAVLDGAQDPRIEYLLLLWGLEHECLYGAVGADLRNAAPFLVRLEQEAAGTLELLRECTTKEWGIYAVAPKGTGFRPALRHFRRLLRVLDPDGDIMLFRYYDPIVLKRILQVFDKKQTSELFGPFSNLYGNK